MRRHSHHDMHESSLEAYASLDLNDRERLVLEAFEQVFQPMTDRECGLRLGWEVTSIRPRVSDLHKAGLLLEAIRVEEEGSRTKVRTCYISDQGRKYLAKLRGGVPA